MTVARQHQHVLELEVLFEDHIVCSGVITDSLVLECVVHGQRALIQPLPTTLQLDNRQKRLHLLLNLAVTYAFPAHTSEFAFQILDLTHVWSNRDSGIVDSDDLLALDAAVYMYIKLHLSPQQRHPHSLPELLAAFAALFVRRQPDAVPGLHSASAVQRVVHAEFRMLQQLGYELS